MKRKTLLIMLLVALFVPLAMNAQTQRLRKNVTRAPRTQLQLEVAGQLQTIEDFQPGVIYNRAAVNNRDNVLYSENFDGETLAGISIVDNDEDGNNWGWYGSIGVDDTDALASESWNSTDGALSPDNWVVFPAVTLPTSGSSFVSVYAKNYNASYSETMGIWVAPENDDYIYHLGNDYNLTSGSFVNCEADLSAYAGQTVQVIIRHYNCSDGTYLIIDNFSIYSRVAEEEITIGSGTSTNAYVPTRTQRRYSLTQQIYTATEIGHTDGGNITSVSFYGSRAATRNLDIYMVNTTQSTISSNTAMHPTTSNRVYSGSVSFTANSWTKITFSTPFEYTGGNVVLIVDDNTGTAANQATNFRVFTANNQAIYIHGAQNTTNTNYNPTSTNLSYTAQNSKNQVKFTIEAAPNPVESITASDLSLMAGFSAQIDYTVLPADATNPAVTFTSANTAIATVSASGVVTGVAAGTTTITLTSVSNPEVSTTINVEVTPFVGLIFDFETDPNEEGWTFVDSDGDGFNWEWEDCSETPHNTPFEGEGCLFSASYDNDNNAALHPDNWAITPDIHILNSPSVVYLYAQGQDADWAAEHFQVYIGTSPDPSSMTAISSEFVATGSYVQYSANIPDTYAGQIVYLAIRHFNVSDMFVLDVDYIVITNAELAPEGILVESIAADDVTVTVGQTANITNLAVLPADATNPAVTYTSNNTGIATVTDAGVVTGVAVGETTITIAATDGSGTTGTINVTVNGIDVTGITVNGDITVVTGETATISYTVAPETATDASVTFTSADETIATVDADGVVTGVGVGETTITITSVSNPEVTATITVTVTSNPNAVQFTVNAPANAHPGDVITVEGVLTAPTNGTYGGFNGLMLGIDYNSEAFAFVTGSITRGTVAQNAVQLDENTMIQTYTNIPATIRMGITVPTEGTFVTAEGVVFSVQFTVLNNAEGNYTFTAQPNTAGNFTHEGEDIPYEATPSTVVVSAFDRYIKPIVGYDDEQTNDLDVDAGHWYLIASPVKDTITPSAENGFLTYDYDLYYFDQTKELEWINYRESSANGGGFSIVSGKGYLYASSKDDTLVFTGTAYSGNGKVRLNYETSNPSDRNMYGWNLVGNPFPVDAYITLNGYTMENANELDPTNAGTAIHPMQGVLVHTNSVDTLTFSTTPPANNGKKLTLNLTKGRSIMDRAIVCFNESKPLPKIQFREGNSKVYFPMDGKDYAVVSAQEQGEMPVNFKAKENSHYTLTVNAEDLEMNYLHLIDNLTGNDVDLLANPSYSFDARTTDYASRFKLVFVAGTAEDNNFAFFSNGGFVINNDGDATLQVIDVNGRILKSESINGCANVNFNAAPAVYMLRLINGDNVKTQKVVVK